MTLSCAGLLGPSVSARYVLSAMLLVLISGWVDRETLAAQSVEGRVVDEDTGIGLAGATLLAVPLIGGDSVRTVTDPEGRFVLHFDEPGRYAISAHRIGYSRVDPREVEVRADERVELLLRLSVTVIRLDSLNVAARGGVLPHLGTWEGFEARYADRNSVGSTRIWDRSDPEMRNAVDVRALLRSSGRIRDWSCMTVFVDGHRAPGWPIGLVLNLSTEQIRGIEFFGRPADAPLAYREPGGCPILVVWRRQ